MSANLNSVPNSVPDGAPDSVPAGTQTLEAAQQVLNQFTCLEPGIKAIAPYDVIRAALKRVADHSDYQILGICADDLAQGTTALVSYAAALGYQPVVQFNPIDGPVYIKFNPKSGLCYADSYVGTHRGVLVSCQSAYESGINGMYGHLPLDLFQKS